MDEPERPLEGRDPRFYLLVATFAVVVIGLVTLALALLDVGPFDDGTLTKGEFIAQGDQICGEAHSEFAQRQQAPPRTAQEAADLANQLAGVSEQELNAIRNLKPPSELQPEVDAYLAARENGIALLRKGADAATGGDAKGYSGAQEKLAMTQAERTKLAEAVGFGECSKPVTATDTRQAAPSDPDN